MAGDGAAIEEVIAADDKELDAAGGCNELGWGRDVLSGGNVPGRRAFAVWLCVKAAIAPTPLLATGAPGSVAFSANGGADTVE